LYQNTSAPQFEQVKASDIPMQDTIIMLDLKA